MLFPAPAGPSIAMLSLFRRAPFSASSGRRTCAPFRYRCLTSCRLRQVSAYTSTRTQSVGAPSTASSCAHSNGTSASPRVRAASAGKAAVISGVPVKTMLTKSLSLSPLASRRAVSSSSVARSTASLVFASQIVAPLMAIISLTPKIVL